MFHATYGLFFSREQNPDTIRIIRTTDGQPVALDGSNVVFNHLITIETFASIMASMCQRGETAETWREAMEFLYSTK